VKLVRDGRFDEGPRVEASLAHKAVEKDELEAGKSSIESLNGLDDVPDPFSLPVNPAVAQDFEVTIGSF
jgi:hypothetical protein